MRLIRVRKINQEQMDQLFGLLMDGYTIKQISVQWNVNPKAIYYRLHANNINMVKVKKKMDTLKKSMIMERRRETKKQGRTYYYYLNQSVKKGDMDKKKMHSIMTNFYNNRHMSVDVFTEDK